MLASPAIYVVPCRKLGRKGLGKVENRSIAFIDSKVGKVIRTSTIMISIICNPDRFRMGWGYTSSESR